MKYLVVLFLAVLLAGCVPVPTVIPTFVPTRIPTSTEVSTPTFTPVPPTSTPTSVPMGQLTINAFIDSNQNSLRDSELGVVVTVSLSMSGTLQSVTTGNDGTRTEELPVGSYDLGVLGFDLPPLIGLSTTQYRAVVQEGKATEVDIPFIDFRTPIPYTPTSTSTATGTATPTVKPVVYTEPPPGLYEQYDWPCPWPLVVGTLPNGTRDMLCPSGLDDHNNYKSIEAFRTAGGMDWTKAKAESPDVEVQNSLRYGAIFWISWQDLEPGNRGYHWELIDNYIKAIKDLGLIMDTPTGPAPKGVYVRIFGAISTRPGKCSQGTVDEGCEFDDLTPSWVKGQIGGQIAIPMKLVDGDGKLTGQYASNDNGSYMVRTGCIFQDAKAARTNGDNWNGAYWTVPKSDNPIWRAAAYQMLEDVARHYDGQDVSFIVGLNGMDGEYGNWLTNSFAGCEGLRQAFTDQYGKGNADMDVRELPQAYAKGTTSRTALFSCSSDCDADWFGSLGFGLFQARAVDDGPNLHRSGDIGVLDMANKFGNKGLSVGWEAAYPFAYTNYMYPMLSVIQSSWPDFFSLVGGSWAADPNLLRSFLPLFGQSITTTPAVWWQAYWTCYGNEVVCPDVGVWGSFQYTGWLGNIQVGLTTTAPMVPVVDLTGTQKTQPWSKMLRKATGTIPFNVDTKWPVKGPYTVTVDFVDTGAGTLALAYNGGGVVLKRSGTGLLETDAVSIPTTRGLALVVGGSPIYLHKFTVGTLAALPPVVTTPTAVVTPTATPKTTSTPYACGKPQGLSYYDTCKSACSPTNETEDPLGSCGKPFVCCLPKVAP